MARIPFNPLQDVMPSSSMPRANVSADTFGGSVGEALRGIGEKGSQIAAQQMGEANEASAKDADVQLQRKLNDLSWGENGYFKNQQKAALDNYKPTNDAAHAAQEEIAATLPNDRARLMFNQAAAAHLLNFDESMGRHASQQRQLWLLGSSDARAKETISQASLFYNDDKRFNQAVATAKDEAMQQSALLGETDPAQVDLRMKSYESLAWTQRISRMVTAGDVTNAADLFHANESKFEPAQVDNLTKMLKQSLIPVQTDRMISGIMNGSSTPAGNFVDGIEFAESRGRDTNADGTILEGPMTKFGTAKGKMQVLDITNQSPGFGIAPAKDNSNAERARVGRDFAAAMLQRYGNQSAAAAAYNWGPGNVDKLIEKGIDPRNGPAAEQLFLSKLPEATVDYIAEVQKKSPSTPGTPPTDQDIDKHLPEWQAQVERAARAAWPEDPGAQQQALSVLHQRVAVIQAGNNAMDRQASDAIFNAIMGTSTTAGIVTQLPIGDRPKSLEELMKLPQMRDLWPSMSGEKQHAFLSMLEQNAGGKNPPASQPALAKYYELLGKQVNDPDGFLNTNLADPELVKLLPQQLVLNLMGTQHTMADKQERSLQKAANITQTITLAARLGMLKDADINVNAKPGSSDASKLNAFTGQLSGALDDFVTTNKRQPNQSEQRDIVSHLLTTGYMKDSGFLWDNRKRAFEAAEGGQISQWRAFVPQDKKAQLFDIMKAQLKRDPTEDEMVDEWTRRVRVVKAAGK